MTTLTTPEHSATLSEKETALLALCKSWPAEIKRERTQRFAKAGVSEQERCVAQIKEYIAAMMNQAAFDASQEQLVHLYGTGRNGDVHIHLIDGRVSVVAHGLSFAWPRLVRDGAFIQVIHFADDAIYRLEFMTNPRLMPDENCYVLLELGPDRIGPDVCDDFDKYLDREDWIFEEAIGIVPNADSVQQDSESQTSAREFEEIISGCSPKHVATSCSATTPQHSYYK